MIALAVRWWSSLRGTSGQALPAAVGALALGAVLVTPMLNGAATSSRYTNEVGARARERYSMDAGIEWSGWRLMSDPRLTADATFSATPLLPLPGSINGAAFPATDIRFIAGAGAIEAQDPPWQPGLGVKCYTFSASDAGTLSLRINIDSGQVWVALLPEAAACSLPPATLPLLGAGEFGADVALPSAGTYQLLVNVDAATTGTLHMSVPAATYEVRSSYGTRNVVARLVAGYSGVRAVSWQLN